MHVNLHFACKELSQNCEPCPNLPAGVLSPEQNSYSPMGWTGLPMGFSHVPSSSIPPNPSALSRPIVLWDGRYCPWDSHMSHPQVYPPNPSVPSRPTILWDGRDCPWDSHVPSSSIPPNPSVPSHPIVLWDGRYCPWDSHMSHPQVYPPNPSVPSRPTILWDGRDCPWDSHVPSSSIPPNPSVPSHPTVLWDGLDCPWDSHVSLLQFLEPDLSITMKALLFYCDNIML